MKKSDQQDVIDLCDDYNHRLKDLIDSEIDVDPTWLVKFIKSRTKLANLLDFHIKNDGELTRAQLGELILLQEWVAECSYVEERPVF